MGKEGEIDFSYTGLIKLEFCDRIKTNRDGFWGLSYEKEKELTGRKSSFTNIK